MKKKLSMNYLDVLVWTENNKRLLGASVQNVYYKEGLLWMKLKPKGSGAVTLIAEPGRRVHLTASPPEAPERLHPFAGGLRKYLRGARLKEIGTVGHDRVLKLTFERGGESYDLIVELVPRGVAVLVGPGGEILYANEYKEMRDRKIKRGEQYKPPPGPDFDPFEDLENLKDRIAKGKDVVRGLVIGQKVPADVAEEVLYRAGVDKSKKPKELSEEELERIKEKIREVYEESFSGEGYLAYSDGPFAFEPFEPKLLLSQGMRVEKDKLDEVLDKYFSTVKAEEVEEDVEERVAREIEKLKKAMEEQKALAEEYKRRSEEYQRLATVIAAHYAEVLEELNKSKSDVVRLTIDGIEVTINKKVNLDEYIRSLFAKSKEYEKKYKRALKAYEELASELEEVESKVREEIAKERAKMRKKEWYEKYHWLITSSGFLAIGGKDASQNEAVVRRYLEDEDYFLHAEVQGAPAVVLKVQGKEPGEEDLREAAFLTACYSKAWKEGRGSVDVFYVRGSQVSKSPPSGQYVAKGAFIIKGKREYIKDVPLRLAIGVELKEGFPRVIVGPQELVERKSIAYAVLVPGDTEKRKVAQKLKRLWANKLEDPELRGFIEGLREEEIMERIPGKSKVIKVAVPMKRAASQSGEEEAGLGRGN